MPKSSTKSSKRKSTTRSRSSPAAATRKRLRLEWVAAGSLKDNPRNWRRHPAAQTEALAGVIEDPELGWAGALLYNERTKRLIDGHARKDLVDPATLVPVLIGHWSPAAERKILLTLDPLANMALPDAGELQRLMDDVELDGDAFAGLRESLEAELQALRGADEAQPVEVEQDEVPEPPGEPVTKPGDLWLLGEHRVLCGDSTKAEDVGRVMGGDIIGLVHADPPYGMRLDTDYSKMPERRIASKTYERVVGDDAAFDASLFLLRLSDVAEQFWWGGDFYYTTLPPGGSWVVWDKRNENSDNLVGNQFELCWSKTRHRRRFIRHHWCGVNARNADARRTHPTEKSVAVVVELLEGIAGIILDPFLGSGTTMIAAEQLGRKCYGLELEPKYVDVICRRWHNLTGKVPKLEDGREFPC